MIKLWARTVKNNKTTRTHDYVRDEKMEWADFFEHVANLCHEMDLPTPVIIKTHLFNYAKFNYVRFLKSDFVESVDFDYLMIENVNK